MAGEDREGGCEEQATDEGCNVSGAIGVGGVSDDKGQDGRGLAVGQEAEPPGVEGCFAKSRSQTGDPECQDQAAGQLQVAAHVVHDLERASVGDDVAPDRAEGFRRAMRVRLMESFPDEARGCWVASTPRHAPKAVPATMDAEVCT